MTLPQTILETTLLYFSEYGGVFAFHVFIIAISIFYAVCVLVTTINKI